MARDKLDELSHDLSDRERQQLLRKIEGTRPEESPDAVRPEEIQAEERMRLIAQDMARLSWFGHLVLWLEGLLTGKDAKAVLVRAKVRELKNRIKQVNASLTGFESRDLRPRFAQLVYELFYRVTPVADVCRALTRDQELQDFAFSDLIERSLPNAKKNVEELLPLEEMERIYAQKGSVEEIRKQLLRSLADYQKGLPRETIAAIEEQLRPLFYLEKLVCFSYGSLFRYFNYEAREPLEQKYPPFDAAPAMLLLNHMERLLYGLHLAREVPEDWVPPQDLIRLYLLKRHGSAQLEGAADAEAIAGEAARIGEGLSEVLEAAAQLASRLPLLDLVRYFRRDPYYRLHFTPPTVDIVSAYTKSLKTRFLDQLREKTDTIKQQAIERRSVEFFRGPLTDLAHYNGHPDFDFRKLGMPYFSYTRSLTLLYNYLGRVYKSYVHEVVQLANTTVLAANKLVQNRLMQSDSQVEDVEPRIAAFDASLAPEEEEGKALLSFRHNLSSDVVQQRFFKSFVADKDRQARALVERAQVHLAEVVRVLDDTINSPTESLKAVLRTSHLVKGKAQPLASLLTTRRDNLREFLDILDQVLGYEKGS